MSKVKKHLTDEEIRSLALKTLEELKHTCTADQVVFMSAFFANLVINTSIHINCHPKIILSDFIHDFLILTYQNIDTYRRQQAQLAAIKPVGTA